MSSASSNSTKRAGQRISSDTKRNKPKAKSGKEVETASKGSPSEGRAPSTAPSIIDLEDNSDEMDERCKTDDDLDYTPVGKSQYSKVEDEPLINRRKYTKSLAVENRSATSSAGKKKEATELDKYESEAKEEL